MYTEIVAGFGGIIVFGLIVRFQQGRLNKLADQKQDRRACDSLVQSIMKDLDRGSKRFDKIEDKIDGLHEKNAEQTTFLELIDQKVSFLADKNGFR